MKLFNLILIIGQYGPFILLFISFYLLKNLNNYLFYFTFGYFLNILLNIVLKGLFKQPRPMDDERLFNIAIKNGKRFLMHNGMPFDMFGMPSGHAQSVMYSTCFIFLVLKNMYITIFYLFISSITIFQRVFEKFHTIFQVIVGSIVGCLFAYLIYYLGNNKLMGNIKLKKDDFGPIY
jgi:membrane-associated phospholipid phosphatase